MIKVWFEDFWGGVCAFDIYNNIFTRALQKIDDVTVTKNNPDIVIHHQFNRNGHLKHKCLKIGYVAENRRPDFKTHDFCISNDYNDNTKHLRYPLWKLFLNEYSDIDKLINQKPDYDKKKFCSFIVSAKGKGIRDGFYKKLSKYKHIDSYGKVFRNMPDIIPQNNKVCWRQPKIDLLRNEKYKFALTFENNSVPGYCTEKILDGLESGLIPIYWGNEKIRDDFNTERFLNYHDFQNEPEFIEYIKEVDNNTKLYNSILSKPIFTKDQILYHKKDILYEFLNCILNRKT